MWLRFDEVERRSQAVIVGDQLEATAGNMADVGVFIEIERPGGAGTDEKVLRAGFRIDEDLRGKGGVISWMVAAGLYAVEWDSRRMKCR